MWGKNKLRKQLAFYKEKAEILAGLSKMYREENKKLRKQLYQAGMKREPRDFREGDQFGEYTIVKIQPNFREPSPGEVVLKAGFGALLTGLWATEKIPELKYVVENSRTGMKQTLTEKQIEELYEREYHS